MERVLSYRGLEIESLKSLTNDRKIGWRCTNWHETDATTRRGQCVGSWEHYSDVYGEPDFNNFLRFIGDPESAIGSTSWLKQKADGSIDLDKTAKYCWDKYSATPERKAPNFPPHNVMKTDTDSWAKFVGALSDIVAKAPDDLPSHAKGQAREIRSNFMEMQRRVLELRLADHGVTLNRKAKRALLPALPKGIVFDDYGANILDARYRYSFPNWAKTAKLHLDFGFTKDAVLSIIGDFTKDYYDARTPRDHRAVLRAYQRGEARARKCV